MPDKPEPRSSAGADAESTEDLHESQDLQSSVSETAVIAPTVVGRELPAPAQAAIGADEQRVSDGEAEGSATGPIAIGVSDSNQRQAGQRQVVALTKANAKPHGKQPSGPVGGQAGGASGHASEELELTENRAAVVTPWAVGEEQANERAAEGFARLPSGQSITEIAVAAAVGLESGHMEVERTSIADVREPLAGIGEPATSPASTSASIAAQLLPSRLPLDLLAAASGRPTRAIQPSDLDSTRLIQRVARAFAATREGSGEVRLRLSPPELGALRLEIKVESGAVVARIETETSAARAALIENLPALRERLAEQGMRIERFDVDVMKRGDERAFDHPAHQAPQEHKSQPELQPRQRRLPIVADGVVARTTILGDLDQRRLNVLV